MPVKLILLRFHCDAMLDFPPNSYTTATWMQCECGDEYEQGKTVILLFLFLSHQSFLGCYLFFSLSARLAFLYMDS